MANVFAIHSVGASIADYLGKTYPTELSTQHACQFHAVSSFDFTKANDFPSATVSVYLYRVTVNEQLRNASRVNSATGADVPLSLDLHFMVTVWANDVLTEHLIMAWTMRQLYARQTLTAAELSPEGGWGASDVVQLIPAEITTSDLMRIWDELEPMYRLSTTYVARAVRIDGDVDLSSYAPVVATRYEYRERGQP